MDTSRIDDAILDALTAGYKGRWVPRPSSFDRAWGGYASDITMCHPFSTRLTEWTETKESDRVEGIVGFRKTQESDLANLALHAEQMTKLLFALSHLYGHGAGNGAFGFVPRPDLMDAMGYARKDKGQHHTSNRETTIASLQLLSRLEVCFNYRVGLESDGRWGKVWNITPGTRLRQECEWDDDANLLGVEICPAVWRHESVWRRRNQHTGTIDRDYFWLRCGNAGRAAIFLGAKLAVHTAINRHTDRRRYKVPTLEIWAGLDGIHGDRPQRRRDKLGAALDELQRCRVIADWKAIGSDDIDVSFIQPAPTGAAFPDGRTRRRRRACA